MKKVKIPKHVTAMSREALEADYVRIRDSNWNLQDLSLARFSSDKDYSDGLILLCREAHLWIAKLTRRELVTTVESATQAVRRK